MIYPNFCSLQSENDRKKKKKRTDGGSPAKGGGSKIKCMYWEKCYRKDPAHLAQYRHPAATVGTKGVLTRRASEVHESSQKGESSSNGGSKTVKPTNSLDDGESVEIGSGVGKYRIKRTGDSYYCT